MYQTWQGMKDRCYNKNNTFYKYYGNKEIKVCDEWKNDFVKFRDWALTNGYKDNLTIDRINNDGNYEPSNCKFSTRKEQNRNFSRNKRITYKGETHCMSEWAEILGMSKLTLNSRLNNYNWSVERAFTEKVHIECGRTRILTFRGETHCVTEWAEILGVDRNTIYNRLNNRGWSIEKALTTKVRSRRKKGK